MISPDLEHSLLKLGIKRTDVVMIHGDAIVSRQLNLNNTKKKFLELYIDMLIEFFKPGGTLIVPSFSYNISAKKIFDKERTPSKIGMFSESFRKKANVVRSNHPIFSVCSIGKYSKRFLRYNLNDCFGQNSFFDVFTKLNGKIICMGCPLEEITYFHYIEQKMNVNYRFKKTFLCAYKEKKKERKIRISYFVRDLNRKSSLNLKFLRPKIRDIINISKFGRFEFTSLESKKLLKKSKILLKHYPNILIGEKNAI